MEFVAEINNSLLIRKPNPYKPEVTQEAWLLFGKDTVTIHTNVYQPGGGHTAIAFTVGELRRIADILAERMAEEAPQVAEQEADPVEVDEMTAEEWDAALQRRADELGISLEQVIHQGRSGRFGSVEVMKLWYLVNANGEYGPEQCDNLEDHGRHEWYDDPASLRRDCRGRPFRPLPEPPRF